MNVKKICYQISFPLALNQFKIFCLIFSITPWCNIQNSFEFARSVEWKITRRSPLTGASANVFCVLFHERNRVMLQKWIWNNLLAQVCLMSNSSENIETKRNPLSIGNKTYFPLLSRLCKWTSNSSTKN